MTTRREFLKSAVLSTSSVIAPANIFASKSAASEFFGVHPFIENHPDAVFIMHTDVEIKTNHKALKNAGIDFGRSVLVPKDDGVPITSMIPIKPNLTNIMRSHVPEENVEYRMGIVTDPWFVEGVIESLKELDVSGDQVYLVETWHLDNWGPIGYDAMAERTGAHQNDTREN